MNNLPESNVHISLVRQMYKWVLTNLINDKGLIFVDLPESRRNERPPSLGDGHFPDLYANDTKSGLMIVGEAKTAGDIEKLHSIEQYKSYFETLKYCPYESKIVLAVPNYYKQRMNSVIKRVKRESNSTNVDAIILGLYTENENAKN